MPTTAERNINLLTPTTEDGFLTGHLAAGAARSWDTKPMRRGRAAGVRTLTSTAYDLLESDEGQFLRFAQGASAAIITIRNDELLVCPVGWQCEIMRNSAGKVSVAAGEGVSILHPSTGAGRFARLQNSVMKLRKIGVNTWVVYGDTAAS